MSTQSKKRSRPPEKREEPKRHKSSNSMEVDVTLPQTSPIASTNQSSSPESARDYIPVHEPEHHNAHEPEMYSTHTPSPTQRRPQYASPTTTNHSLTPNMFQQDRSFQSPGEGTPRQQRRETNGFLPHKATPEDYIEINSSPNKICGLPKPIPFLTALSATFGCVFGLFLLAFLALNYFPTSPTKPFCDTDFGGESALHTDCLACPLHGYCASGSLIDCPEAEGMQKHGWECTKLTSKLNELKTLVHQSLTAVLANSHCKQLASSCSALTDEPKVPQAIDTATQEDNSSENSTTPVESESPLIPIEKLKLDVYTSVKHQGDWWTQFENIWEELLERIKATPALYGVTIHTGGKTTYVGLDSAVRGSGRMLSWKCQWDRFWCQFPLGWATGLLCIVVYAVYTSVQSINKERNEATGRALLGELKHCVAKAKWTSFSEPELVAHFQDKHKDDVPAEEFGYLWDKVVTRAKKDKALEVNESIDLPREFVFCGRASRRSLVLTPGSVVSTPQTAATASPISPTKMVMH